MLSRKWVERLLSPSFLIRIAGLMVIGALLIERAQAQTLTSEQISELDQMSDTFTQRTEAWNHLQECIPTQVSSKNQVVYHYLFCSIPALEIENQGKKISSNFKVPKGLSRRFYFWKRVYSLWTADQYVLHSAEFPEVVFEISDIFKAGEGMTNRDREIFAHKLLKERKKLYQKLLTQLHKDRNKDPATLSPALRRVAKMMAHIKQPNKYLLVSQSLRVQRGQRDFIERGLLPASRYMTALEEEFRKVGVPLELTKLAFVESSFNVLAYSKVGASGIYQIMPATAKQYGMKESDFYDERRDPVKSARAAAKLLKLNYKITGSWPLSITAYNHGVGSIKKAIRKTRSSDITHIVHNYEAKSFGFASQNFYTGFLGLLATLEEKEKLFPNVKFDQPIKFQNVKLKRPISISIILRRSHVTPDEFAELNPDIFRRYIKRGGILPQGYVVKLPQRVQVSSSF